MLLIARQIFAGLTGLIQKDLTQQMIAYLLPFGRVYCIRLKVNCLWYYVRYETNNTQNI